MELENFSKRASFFIITSPSMNGDMLEVRTYVSGPNRGETCIRASFTNIQVGICLLMRFCCTRNIIAALFMQEAE